MWFIRTYRSVTDAARNHAPAISVHSYSLTEGLDAADRAAEEMERYGRLDREGCVTLGRFELEPKSVSLPGYCVVTI